MIESYFNGWLGIAILTISAFVFAYAGSFGYFVSAICAITAGVMIYEKMRGF
jgi:hypothetical protein